MADKIRNNVKKGKKQFSWKLTFPKGVALDEMNENGIMILNRNLKRLRTEFTINTEENAISISPQTPYKAGCEYFFWAKYKKKEICVAFTIGTNHEMQTYDHKTSMDKLTVRLEEEAQKAAKADSETSAGSAEAAETVEETQ